VSSEAVSGSAWATVVRADGAEEDGVDEVERVELRRNVEGTTTAPPPLEVGGKRRVVELVVD
jgi:hypothetical protein